MTIIPLEEQHSIILEIAKEFSYICDKNNIPYYMLGGTMLGAIRHKGFIPWDDDMDFGIPRPYYQAAINALEKELKPPYRCCTYKNHEGCITPFMKIANMDTVIDDPRVNLPLSEQIGLNIDIFPLDYCEANNPILKKIKLIAKIHRIVYVGNSSRSIVKTIVKKVLGMLFPIERKKLRDMQEKLLANLPNGKYLANVYGRWESKEVIPIEWYGEKTLYDFEDKKFSGIKDYDKYLSQMYGDYMQLPPENKRTAHTDIVYWKRDISK